MILHEHTDRPLRIGSLFSGYGGLDAGVIDVFGGRVVWHSEIDPAASRVLTHRWPGIPNLGDITTVGWGSEGEPVDVLTAGWPCQPFSLAGKRKGADDDRALWPWVSMAVCMLRPRLVVLENVAAIVTAGELDRATADLAALGYVGSWACVRASDVGAPHRRERCFVVAWPTADPCGEARRPEARGTIGRSGAGAAGQRPAEPGRLDRAAADPGGVEPERRGGPRELEAQRLRNLAKGVNGERSGHALVGGGAVAADAVHDRREGRAELDRRAYARVAGALGDDADGRSVSTDWGRYEPAIQRWELILGRPAPAPTEPGSKGQPRLSPRFVEWLMGLPAGWVTDVPGVTRTDALRLLGNGVVPQQAAYALRLLLSTDLESEAS